MRSGKLRGLATTGRARSRIAPELPTVAEAGLPGYQSSLWYVLMAPAKTPETIVRRLHTEAARLVKLPEAIEQLLTQGADPIGSSPREAREFLRAEIARWTKLIQDAGIRAD